MKTLVNKNLPKLIHVSRPVAWQTLTFAVFNLLLGAALFTAQARALDFFIINDVMTPQFWGVVFFSIGLAKLFGYFTNNWTIMRYANIPALFTKLFWLIALVARQIETPSTNIFLILMFTALASLQIALYLHFPTNKEARRESPTGDLTIAKELIK